MSPIFPLSELVYGLGEDVLYEGRALVLGGGGYIIPQMLIKEFEMIVDVVEIDPKITTISDNLTNFSANENINVYHLDGRVFVDKTDKEYDLLVLDVFFGDSVPFHMATNEAIESYEKALKRNGMMVVNSFARDGVCLDEFMSLLKNTLEHNFNEVRVYANEGACEVRRKSNTYFIASNRENSYNSDILGFEMLAGDYFVDKDTILTDNYFPTRYTH
jgi:spermidine synthase